MAGFRSLKRHLSFHLLLRTALVFIVLSRTAGRSRSLLCLLAAVQGDGFSKLGVGLELEVRHPCPFAFAKGGRRR